ncbi:MAG: DNA recombination protein RmuC [Bacteroidetes bacterium]|nr:DNA recombination protein RmuC [Bacteroidota bacterium]
MNTLLLTILAAVLGVAFTWFFCRARMQTLAALLAQSQLENEKLNTALTAAQSACTELSKESARQEATLRVKEEQLAAQQVFIETARADMEREFRIIAANTLEQNARSLGAQQETKLTDLLRPFREQILNFQESVGKHFLEEGKEKTLLQKEISLMRGSSELLSRQANSLSEALRGSTKQQGDWGEGILEKILEHCGLQEGIHFTIQAAARSEEGIRYRPDVVLHLPGSRNLVIDAKVSLNAYWDMCACEDEAARVGFPPKIVAALRNHVDELHRRPYHEVSGTPGYLIMFVPVEAAYICALQHDGSLWKYAYDKNILIISPTNLIPFLRMVEALWDREKKYEHAEAIAKQAGALYDKLAGFVETYQKLGNALTAAQKNYDESYGQLATGRGNLLSRAEQMKAMGISNKKSLPQQMAERAQLNDGMNFTEDVS